MLEREKESVLCASSIRDRDSSTASSNWLYASSRNAISTLVLYNNARTAWCGCNGGKLFLHDACLDFWHIVACCTCHAEFSPPPCLLTITLKWTSTKRDHLIITRSPFGLLSDRCFLWPLSRSRDCFSLRWVREQTSRFARCSACTRAIARMCAPGGSSCAVNYFGGRVTSSIRSGR